MHGWYNWHQWHENHSTCTSSMEYSRTRILSIGTKTGLSCSSIELNLNQFYYMLALSVWWRRMIARCQPCGSQKLTKSDRKVWLSWNLLTTDVCIVNQYKWSRESWCILMSFCRDGWVGTTPGYEYSPWVSTFWEIGTPKLSLCKRVSQSITNCAYIVGALGVIQKSDSKT